MPPVAMSVLVYLTVASESNDREGGSRQCTVHPCLNCGKAPDINPSSFPFLTSLLSRSLSLSLDRAAKADYHFVYNDMEGASTQWDDIQRKVENLPEKPEPFKPPPFAPKVNADEQPKSKEWLDAREPDELEELGDDFEDDRFLEQYRRMRPAELREAAKTTRFGTIESITGSDFVREVSQAPQDVWIPECGLLHTFLEELATKYAETKFVKIISTDCIPNYPDRNVPTIPVYNNSAVKGSYVGLQKFGGNKCTPESVALVLCHSDPVLNDGQGGGDSSCNNVIDGVRSKFIEKLVAQHEAREDEDDSD